MMDARRSMRAHDARESLPLQTPRRCGDLPFLQWTQHSFHFSRSHLCNWGSQALNGCLPPSRQPPNSMRMLAGTALPFKVRFASSRSVSGINQRLRPDRTMGAPPPAPPFLQRWCCATFYGAPWRNNRNCRADGCRENHPDQAGQPNLRCHRRTYPDRWRRCPRLES